MSKAYPSNLLRPQYDILSDLIPEPKSGVLVKWRCGRYSTRSSMFCVKDVAGERYLETFQPGRRYTPISQLAQRWDVVADP